jgi:peptide-methionine (R)-S-oxide reductase
MISLFFGLIVLTSPLPEREVKAEDKLILSNQEWKQRLTPQQYKIMRKKHTEPAFSGQYCNFQEEGIYICAACTLSLFNSKAKQESKGGWANFSHPILPQNIAIKKEQSFFRKRIEVICSRCNSHLGYLIEDHSVESGKSYSVNSIALKFIPEKTSN